MTKPKDFILSSDYATLKNDGRAIGKLTIPTGETILSGQQKVFSQNVVVGSGGGIVMARIRVNGGDWSCVDSLSTFVKVSIPGQGEQQNYIVCYIERINETTIQLRSVVENPPPFYPGDPPSPPMTITQGCIFDVEVRTFKASFN